MTNEKYIGKLILIGISFIAEDGELLEQYQTHGIIESIEDNGMMRITRKGLPMFFLPFHEKNIFKAKPGIYGERSSGVKIENPDYITSSTLNKSQSENIDEYKKNGFKKFIPTEN